MPQKAAGQVSGRLFFSRKAQREQFTYIAAPAVLPVGEADLRVGQTFLSAFVCLSRHIDETTQPARESLVG